MLLALFAWNLDLISSSSGSHLPLCVATVHGSFWTNFVFSTWRVDSELSAQFSPWKSEHYLYEQYLAVTACVSLRCFWKNFTSLHRDGGLGPLRSSHLKICTLFLHAVMWRWDVFFLAVLTHFSHSSRWSGVECHFLEPSMAKSSSPSRAPAQFHAQSLLTQTLF